MLDAIDKTLIPSAQNAELKDLLVKVRPAIAARRSPHTWSTRRRFRNPSGSDMARTRARASMIKAVALACVCVACLPQAAASGKAAIHTVVIEGAAFAPATLTVKRVDKVKWINKDPFPHTATAEDHSFDSRSIGANKSWTYTTKKRGEFPYLCKLHPTMKALLVVQ